MDCREYIQVSEHIVVLNYTDYTDMAGLDLVFSSLLSLPVWYLELFLALYILLMLIVSFLHSF